MELYCLIYSVRIRLQRKNQVTGLYKCIYYLNSTSEAYRVKELLWLD
jgi:hypothetical protein